MGRLVLVALFSWYHTTRSCCLILQIFIFGNWSTRLVTCFSFLAISSDITVFVWSIEDVRHSPPHVVGLLLPPLVEVGKVHIGVNLIVKKSWKSMKILELCYIYVVSQNFTFLQNFKHKNSLGFKILEQTQLSFFLFLSFLTLLLLLTHSMCFYR